MLLKVSYEIENLKELVSERERLVKVLGLTPSKNDDVQLKKQLEVIQKLFQEESSDISTFVQEYKSLVSEIRDLNPNLDYHEYQYEYSFKMDDDNNGKAMVNNGGTEMSSSKKVRFNDNNMVSYRDDDGNHHTDDEESDGGKKFKPFKDDMTTVDDNLLPLASNREIYIQQQQQLLDQDSQLGVLSDSVSRTHEMSTDINREIVDQNATILNDLENLIDNNGRSLNRAKKRLDIFQKTAKENGPCFIIIILIIILLFLLIVL